MSEIMHRRLSDKILVAFAYACERGETEVAEHLLRALEVTLTSHETAELRQDVEPLASAYAALEELRTRRDVA
jgi:hypothetical protein